jgi:16S rRNA (cytosine967-C5)-methyltransferase
LESLESKGGFANELLRVLLDSAAEGSAKSILPADRALARELVYGVCRWRSRLDWALSQVSDQPVVDLDERLKTILRLGPTKFWNWIGFPRGQRLMNLLT